jgi:hypothetical protein
MSIYIKQPIRYDLFTENLKHSYLEVKYMCCTERGKIVKNKLLFSGAGALKGGGGFAVDQRLYSKKNMVYGTLCRS